MDLLQRKSKIYQQLGSADTNITLSKVVLSQNSGSLHNAFQTAKNMMDSGFQREAIQFLQNTSGYEKSCTCCFLVALAYFHLEEYEECLQALNYVRAEKFIDITTSDARVSCLTCHDPDCSENNADEVIANTYLIKGKVFEFLENIPKAIQSFKASLEADRYCIESFHRLVYGLILPMPELAQFISDLFKADKECSEKWIYHYYTAHITSNYLQAEKSIDYLETKLGFENSATVWSLRTRLLFSKGDARACVKSSKITRKLDPSLTVTLQEELASLASIQDKEELYILAHNLVDRHPKLAESWLAIGYYYMVINNPEMARRNFQKATILNPRLGSAWMAFGHSFAAQEESDQAMAAYRTAARLFPGSHLPLIHIGIEYSRQSSFANAIRFFSQAKDIAPNDPRSFHECGVVAYRLGEWKNAIKQFEAARSRILYRETMSNNISKISRLSCNEDSATISLNLGHCYRRIGEYETAKSHYEDALIVMPRNGEVAGGLGIIYHVTGKKQDAVAMYHRALEDKPEDMVILNLLDRALSDLTMESPIPPELLEV